MVNDFADELNKFSGKFLVKESASIICNPYYHKFIPGMERLIRLSRQQKYQTSPMEHLGLQLAILQTLEQMDGAVSEGKALAKKENSESIALRQRQNKYLARAYREIGDGIAWRTLDYSRFRMRILSQGRSAGHTDNKAGRKAETDLAMACISNGNRVIINDATTSVRIGDLIGVIPDGKFILTEVKKGKKEPRPITVTSIMRKLKANQPLTKQEGRLLQAQYHIDSNTFPVGADDIPVTYLEHDTQNFLAETQNILRQAARKGIYGKFVAPYMYVEAIDLPKLGTLDYKKLLSQPKVSDFEPIAMFTSYDRVALNYHNEAVRNSPPYTVFPFTPNTVAKLITGEFELRAVLYREPLVEKFRELGWELNINESALDNYKPITTAENVAYFSSEDLFPEPLNDPNDVMTLKKGAYTVSAFNLILGMVQDFFAAENVISFVEAGMKTATPGKSAGIYPESLSERKLWK
ncbi:MAG TPA: hypothetical protein VMR08_02285 [Patescibacteria group bacterium]|nr:hypothetical protein [Patescibacteria group bacterium]